MNPLALLHSYSSLSPLFTIMGAISASSIRWSEVQFRPKQPQVETIDPATSAVPPSSSIPFTSTASGVTLEAVMAQLQRMDARLDYLIDEIC